MLKQIGGCVTGLSLTVLSISYMDDIMYVPIRRAFIRPIHSYYVTNYAPGIMPESTEKMSLSELGQQISDESIAFAKEMKPKSVTTDNIKDFIKDEDYTTREQHYFRHLRSLKETLPAEVSHNKENPTQKYTPDKYDKLKEFGFNEIMTQYSMIKQNKGLIKEDIENVLNTNDMVKIVKKNEEQGRRISKKKTNLSEESQDLKDTLNELFKENKSESPSIASQLLSQSSEYKIPDSRQKAEEHKKHYDNLKELLEKSNQTPTASDIDKYLTTYKGSLELKEVSRTDKQKLNKLRNMANTSEDSKISEPANNESQSKTEPSKTE